MYACKLLCVELQTSWNTWSANNLAVKEFSDIRTVFVHIIKYKTNLAGATGVYNNAVSDVIAPHV